MQLYAISSLQPHVMSTISPFTQLLILFFLENLCGAQRSLPGCFLLVDFNLRKILTLDILWNKGVTVVDWCYMCKRSGESVNHLLLHCLIASEWWTLVWALFGLLWVMPQTSTPEPNKFHVVGVGIWRDFFFFFWHLVLYLFLNPFQKIVTRVGFGKRKWIKIIILEYFFFFIWEL